MNCRRQACKANYMEVVCKLEHPEGGLEEVESRMLGIGRTREVRLVSGKPLREAEFSGILFGEVAERLKAHAWKVCIR